MRYMSKDDFMSKINEFFPDSDDITLERIDFFDKFYDNADSEINENSVEEVEKKWSKKYRERFFEGGNREDDFGDETKKLKFESIFKEGY